MKNSVDSSKIIQRLTQKIATMSLEIAMKDELIDQLKGEIADGNTEQADNTSGND